MLEEQLKEAQQKAKAEAHARFALSDRHRTVSGLLLKMSVTCLVAVFPLALFNNVWLAAIALALSILLILLIYREQNKIKDWGQVIWLSKPKGR
jgi:TRAP-type uncharacterized transport system fused permease subunit